MTPIIQNIERITRDPLIFRPVEYRLAVDLKTFKAHCNPFDYHQVTFFAIVTDPDGKTVRIEAFWTHEVAISLNEIADEPTETLTPGDYEGYEWRYLPLKTGLHQIQFMADCMEETSLLKDETLEVASALGSYQLVSVEPLNHRTFVLPDGSDFIPIGQNLCWPVRGKKGTFSYDPWLKEIAHNGGNWVRIWLRMNHFALHQGSTSVFFNGMGEMAKLDRVMALAQKEDIHVMLCLLQHGLFSEHVNPNWHSNPWNKANGGYLDQPEAFFTDTRAKYDFKNILHYLVARFSSYDHLFAWELFNEVDWTDRYDEVNVASWHDEMAKTIKQIDPNHHMVTTSFKSYLGKADELDSIDFVNPHSYDYFDTSTLTMIQEKQRYVWAHYDKPVLHSEIGFNWRSGEQTRIDDPRGIAFLQGLLGGIFAGGAGTAMSWWWDSYIDPAGLYRYYWGISRIVKRLHFGQKSFSVVAKDTIRCSAENIDFCGYRTDKELYLLVFDKTWSYQNPDVPFYQNVRLDLPFSAGMYQETLYEIEDGRTSGILNARVEQDQLTLRIPILHECIVLVVK